ncbi:MAG: hypothetical protein AAFU85_33520, partial [Planctomycetota bacterium]
MLSSTGMSNTFPLSNLSVDLKRFRYGRRRYPCGLKELESLRLLLQLYYARARCDDGLWAVRSRSVVERLVALDAKALCNAAIENARDETMRQIAIWVRGHLGGYSGIRQIEAVLNSTNDLGARKACVRALARLHGFHLLRRMSEEERDPRIRKLAAVLLFRQQPSSHAERLKQFTQLVRPQSTAQGKRELFVNADSDWGANRKTKSIEFIRSVLFTIQSL